jgi:predicted nucleic acid-binding protein
VTEAAVANIHPLLFHDALICAAARYLELALLTWDGDIRQSGLVRVIW